MTLYKGKTIKGKSICVIATKVPITLYISSGLLFLAALHKACDAAGVERIRWHDLRHYYASRILQAFNGDWWTVTNRMGHESIKTTTNIYGHWLESEEQDAKIADAISGAF